MIGIYNAYIMCLEAVRQDPEYITIARWANQPAMFKGSTFEQFKTGAK